jgi:xanthosine utilization system XapX-like protein
MADWIDTIEKLAPTVASALGSPVAGMAVGALESALGMSVQEVKATVESGKLTAEQVAAIQQSELAIKAKAQELGLDFEKLAVEDRTSARNMQMNVKSWVPPFLALSVTVGFFGILVGMMTQKFATSDALMLMLGSLGTAWTGIISFYFGSSAGSQAKDEAIHAKLNGGASK